MASAVGKAADEVLAIVDRIGAAVMSTAVDTTSANFVQLRRAVGLFVADKNMVNLTAYAMVLTICLGYARQCQATVVTMDRVRKAALEEKPVSPEAVQTVLATVRLTLSSEARIIAAMSFRSREEVDTLANAMNEAFNQTEIIAADALDQGTYMALVGLHGALTKHLADRGRQLPRIIPYSYPVVYPALRIAQRAYNDGARYEELITENHVVHPAFMPRDGKMLAV